MSLFPALAPWGWVAGFVFLTAGAGCSGDPRKGGEEPPEDPFGALCLAFSPDGKVVASGNIDDTIRLWDAARQEQTRVLQGHPEQVRAVAFSPDGKTLSSGDGSGHILLWDTTTWKVRRRLRGKTGTVSYLAFTPDSKQLLASGRPPILWDLTSGKK